MELKHLDLEVQFCGWLSVHYRAFGLKCAYYCIGQTISKVHTIEMQRLIILNWFSPEDGLPPTIRSGSNRLETCPKASTK